MSTMHPTPRSNARLFARGAPLLAADSVPAGDCLPDRSVMANHPVIAGCSVGRAMLRHFDVLEVSFLCSKGRGRECGTPTMLDEFERFS